MSDELVKAALLLVESRTRRVGQLKSENERVRKLLTEFDQRHGADQDRIEALSAALEAERAERNALTTEIDLVWDAIGSRGNRSALSPFEQVTSLMNELDAAEAERVGLRVALEKADALADDVFSEFQSIGCSAYLLDSAGTYRAAREAVK